MTIHRSSPESADAALRKYFHAVARCHPLPCAIAPWRGFGLFLPRGLEAMLRRCPAHATFNQARLQTRSLAPSLRQLRIMAMIGTRKAPISTSARAEIHQICLL